MSTVPCFILITDTHRDKRKNNTERKGSRQETKTKKSTDVSTVPLRDEKIIVVYKKKDLIKQERIFLFFGFLQLEKEHKRKIAQKTI